MCCSSSQKFDLFFEKDLEKLLTTVDDVRVDLIKGLFSCLAEVCSVETGSLFSFF